MLSVITDFGCDLECPYCIYKYITPSTAAAPPDYYERLEAAVRNTSGEAFSISGGGDPLHNFTEHTDFWNHIFRLCQKYDKNIDIHTSYIDASIEQASHLADYARKIVLHCFPSTWSEDRHKLLAVRQAYKNIRINFVIDYQLDMVVSDIEAFCIANDVPLSYRQMVTSSLDTMTPSPIYPTVHLRVPQGRYIKQDDYNIYFSPQGNLELRYMEM